MAILKCTSPFVYWVNGAPVTYTAGQLIDDTDPGLKGHEAHFEPVETGVRRRPPVEQATAEPGERRTVRRTPRSKAKDAKEGDS